VGARGAGRERGAGGILGAAQRTRPKMGTPWPPPPGAPPPCWPPPCSP
jgi:hypothetical protein